MVNIPQPIFVSGRVMLEDGTAPTDSVVIETVCNGQTHGEGYTDARGYFSVELGGRNSVIQDASEMTSFSSMNASGMTGSNSTSGTFGGSGSAERKYMGCDLQAKLAGYRSQTVSLAGRRGMDNPDVGTILLHRNGPAEEGKTISAVSLAAPKDAKKAYEKGMDAIKKKKFDDAQKSFEKAVEVYPKFATVWYELGMLQAGQGKMDMARKYWDTAVECDPKFVKPYLQIAILELQSQKWKGVVEVTDQLVKLDPFDYPQAFFFNSVANYNLRNFEAAEKSARAAERLDTRHAIPKVSHILGMILAMKKDYAGATEHFKAYLKFAPAAEDAAKVRSQLAEVEKITAASAATKEQQEQ
ncbi:MAG: tetratricopeptide repeat protein [Candidatus Solibacter sp.]|nr:tetratricopeptide repeat protein [Candidatus Solibacter sp.]